MSCENFLITEMLNELSRSRSSIKRQNVLIADVLDKSNNAMLQIEASKCIKPTTNDTYAPYTYNRETVKNLIRIMDKFIDMLGDCHEVTANVEEYLEAAGQKADYLGGSIRKLLAITDSVQQMQARLKSTEIDIDSDDESEEYC